MGWLESLIGVGGNLLNWGLNQYSGLSISEKQQNAFNSAEALKGRDFSAAQAELERDWQEEMYAKYNSLSGKIAQAQDAGVNPMYAVTGNAVTPMSPSAGVGSAPIASGSASRGPSLDIAGTILGFSKMKAEIDQMNAYTRQADSNALLNEIDALTRADFNKASLGQAMAAIEVSKADVAVKNQQIGELVSRSLNLDADTQVKFSMLDEIASRIRNNDADTNVKVAQFDEVISRIRNNDADTNVKAAQAALVLMQVGTEREMIQLVKAQTKTEGEKFNHYRAMVHNLWKERDLMSQKYDHNQIMYGLDEIIRENEAGTSEAWNPDNPAARAFFELMKYAKDIFNLSGVVGLK